MPNPNAPLRFGVIGLRRGEGLARAVSAMADARLVALFDTDAAQADTVAARLGLQAYHDLEAFLGADLDVVVVASPMPVHAAQAIAALNAGKHVLSEVMPCTTLAEAQGLVEAVAQSSGRYMLAENCVFYDEIEMVRRLVQQGRFGEVYYGEGDYVHDCDGLWFTPEGTLTWRGAGGLGIYGTHALGPLLHITGDRVAEVTCTALRPGLVQQDVPIATMHLMDLWTAGGRHFRSRIDTVSPRPHPDTTSFSLQGTTGSYESGLREGEGRIWLRDRHGASGVSSSVDWHPLAEMAEELIPDRLAGEAIRTGHGTSEFWMLRAFCEAIRTDGPMPVDVHQALDMTLPCIQGLASAAANGARMVVPNSRDWLAGFPQGG